ncbi:MAG: enoyl-CoA hydratase/isomerase family protein [Chloroflexi bacterium]|nr:enoyl-CoA hydratase/isomerase family protein [Chloroflexota bacterium]
MADHVTYRKDGKIAFVALNRPPHNAYTTQMMRDLERIWLDVQSDPAVWVAIFSGAEGLPFSVGADMKMMFHGDEMKSRAERPPKHQYLGEIKVWKPIIAAVDGYCLGGGMSMALGADLRIASENAVFGMTMLKRGLFPAGATQWLPRMIPRAVAMELLLTGDSISAQRAYEIGLVNRVVPADQLMPAAMEMAQRIAENSPTAVQAIKELSYMGMNEHFDEAIRLSWAMYAENLTSADVKEGSDAFLERRKPTFKGR